MILEKPFKNKENNPSPLSATFLCAGSVAAYCEMKFKLHTYYFLFLAYEMWVHLFPFTLSIQYQITYNRSSKHHIQSHVPIWGSIVMATCPSQWDLVFQSMGMGPTLNLKSFCISLKPAPCKKQFPTHKRFQVPTFEVPLWWPCSHPKENWNTINLRFHCDGHASIQKENSGNNTFKVPLKWACVHPKENSDTIHSRFHCVGNMANASIQEQVPIQYIQGSIVLAYTKEASPIVPVFSPGFLVIFWLHDFGLMGEPPIYWLTMHIPSSFLFTSLPLSHSQLAPSGASYALSNQLCTRAQRTDNPLGSINSRS